MPLISSGIPLKVNFYNSVISIYLWLRIFMMFTAWLLTLIDGCASIYLLSSNLLITQLHASSGYGITTSLGVSSWPSFSLSWFNEDVTYNSFSLIFGPSCFLTSSNFVLMPLINPFFFGGTDNDALAISSFCYDSCEFGCSSSYSTLVNPLSSCSPFSTSSPVAAMPAFFMSLSALFFAMVACTFLTISYF